MNKQQLASKIWALANNLRGKVSAATYKDYILGFLFYKYLSDKEERYLLDKLKYEKDELIEVNEEDTDTANNCMSNVGYFIAYDNLFSTWVALDKSESKDKDLTIQSVRIAISAFNRFIGAAYAKVFEGIFDTLNKGLDNLGTTDPERTTNIKKIIRLIDSIPTDNKEDYDVLGFIYEFLLKNFAANAGKAGEFYTPHEASLIMAEIIAYNLKDKSEISVYDPTSGSGSLLINIGQAVAKYFENKNRVKYFAQELIPETFNLTRMNLVMRDILPSNIIARQGDTLAKDWPYFDARDPENTYEPLFVDACCSNPPYSQAWDDSKASTDPRFRDYGIAPKSKADYAFLLHNLYHLNSGGIMTIVLPHGVLFRGSFNKDNPDDSQNECKIRYKLIEKNHIEAIIGLPANLFYGTGIPTIIMVLKKNRNDDKVLFVDASKGFVKDGNKNRLRQRDIRKIVDTVLQRKTIKNYSRLVEKSEIIENDYNLNIPRYVDSNVKEFGYDIYATMFGGIPNFEIDSLNKYWDAFPTLKAEIFETKDIPYSSVKVEDVKTVIENNSYVKEFIKSHLDKFSYLKPYLKHELIENLSNVSISNEENAIASTIREKINDKDLIEYYDAFEVLDNVWSSITLDLETIKSEDGLASANQIDELTVFKKNTKTKELEEKVVGYEGRIIPFALVQKHYFASEMASLEEHQNILSDLLAKKEELLDSIDPNDKSELLKENGEDIDTKKLTAKMKEINKQIKLGAEYEEGSYESILIEIDRLNPKIKKEKDSVKNLSVALATNTENKLKSLSEDEIRMFLEEKWVRPICDGINGLADKLIASLEKEIIKLSKKYSETLVDIDEGIHNTQKELVGLIDELDADEFDKKGLEEFKKLLGGE